MRCLRLTVQKRERSFIALTTEEAVESSVEDVAGRDLVEQGEAGAQLYGVDRSQDLDGGAVVPPRQERLDALTKVFSKDGVIEKEEGLLKSSKPAELAAKIAQAERGAYDEDDEEYEDEDDDYEDDDEDVDDDEDEDDDEDAEDRPKRGRR